MSTFDGRIIVCRKIKPAISVNGDGGGGGVCEKYRKNVNAERRFQFSADEMCAEL